MKHEMGVITVLQISVMLYITYIKDQQVFDLEPFWVRFLYASGDLFKILKYQHEEKNIKVVC